MIDVAVMRLVLPDRHDHLAQARVGPRTIVASLGAGCFEPRAVEVSFGNPRSPLKGIEIDLGGGLRLRFRGRIDRLDVARVKSTGEVGVRVVDYKMSARELDLTRLYYGLDLQLGGYLLAAVQLIPTYETYQCSARAAEPPAIGNFLPLEQVYSYDPLPRILKSTQAKHILGAQFQLWSEYIPDPKQAECMIFPRACALSEAVNVGIPATQERPWRGTGCRVGVSSTGAASRPRDTPSGPTRRAARSSTR